MAVAELAFPAATQLMELKSQYIFAQKGKRQVAVQKQIMEAMTKFIDTKDVEDANIEEGIVNLEVSLSKAKLVDMATDGDMKAKWAQAVPIIAQKLTGVLAKGAVSHSLLNATNGIRIFEDGYEGGMFQVLYDYVKVASKLWNDVNECSDSSDGTPTEVVEKRATTMAHGMAAWQAVASTKPSAESYLGKEVVDKFVGACSEVASKALTLKGQLDKIRMDASSSQLNVALAVLHDIRRGTSSPDKSWFDDLPKTCSPDDAIKHAHDLKFYGTTNEWLCKIEALEKTRKHDEDLKKSIGLVDMPEQHETAKQTAKMATVTYVEDQLMQLYTAKDTLGKQKKGKVGELIQLVRKHKVKERDALFCTDLSHCLWFVPEG